MVSSSSLFRVRLRGQGVPTVATWMPSLVTICDQSYFQLRNAGDLYGELFRDHFPGLCVDEVFDDVLRLLGAEGAAAQPQSDGLQAGVTVFAYARPPLGRGRLDR